MTTVSLNVEIPEALYLAFCEQVEADPKLTINRAGEYLQKRRAIVARGDE